MKKRHFLKSGTAFLGALTLGQTLSGCSQAAADPEPTVVNPRIPAPEPATFEITKTEAEWREILSSEAFGVLREHKTEAPHSSPLDKNYTAGTYSCAGCDLPLYSSETKFNSGTGWPSFYDSLENAVGTSIDRSFLMTRTEVHCRRCGGHLGHVFNDGPQPTGKRHCINGVSLSFTSV